MHFKVGKASLCIYGYFFQFTAFMLTFPRATVLVAMSRTKLSPSGPGAATEIGFVPSIP